MYYVYVTMQYSYIMYIFSSRIVNFWNSPLCMVAEDDETNYSDCTGAGRSRNPPSHPRIVCDAPWNPNRRVCGASSTANRRREWPEWRPPRRTFKTREREKNEMGERKSCVRRVIFVLLLRLQLATLYEEAHHGGGAAGTGAGAGTHR